MVLKRILVTTLSALGLGALVAGTASGQTAGEGNIPAPDIFDDQITCSMLVPAMSPTPTRVPMGGKTSPLDDAIGDDSAPTGWGTITDSDTLGLGYVIPPEGNNCGSGTGGIMLGAMANDVNGNGMVDPGDTIEASSIPIDVANGYTELLGKFVAVYGNPGGTTGGTARALQAAQKALNDAIERGTTGASLRTYQDAVTRAQTAHNRALATFNDAAGGPIYQAGVAEWMAKAAVSKSIVDYNSQVGKTNMALDDLNALDYGSYVPLVNDDLIDEVFTFDGDGMISAPVLTEIGDYVNDDLTSPVVGTVDPMTGVTTTDDSNFDATGRLIVPMVDDPNSDEDGDTIPLVATGSRINGVDDIRERVRRYNAAAKALEKLRDDNLGSVQAEIYEEAARRARAEADYYNAHWAELLADTTDQRTSQQKLEFIDTNGDGDNSPDDNETTPNDTGADAYVENPITIAGRNAAYTTETNKRFTAEQDLRSKVAAREMATAHVRGQFNDAQAFYAQLVARRQALKVAADRAVANAETPSKAQTEQAANAQEALDAAQKAKADLDELFADGDDPSVALINELLKTGGNDGQALVDAISSNYDTANAAKTRADEVADDVAGLTGDDGAVSMNTAAIQENSDNITALDGRVAANEGEIWDADGNSRIDANEMRSTMNRTMIMTNTENIATNASNIMGLRTDVDQNSADIMTNAGNIMTNSGRITANEGNISANADAIAANMNSIGSNSSAISDNRNMIGELSDDLDVVRAGVAASMALAGMPAINGRGISIGVGSFDGESAFAVGFQIQGEMASFKVGVTSASGATGASAGVGFQF